MPQACPECGGHRRQPVAHVVPAFEQDIAQPLAQRGHHQAGVVGAVENDTAAELALHGTPEPDAGEMRHVGCRHQKSVGRIGQRLPRLVEVMDADDQCCASAATPGSSLPSSHSRKAPPAVET